PHVTTSVDCRYAGQSHELTVDSVADFHALHARRNGYARPDDLVEVIAVRARAATPSPVAVADLPAPPRRRIDGPAVVADADITLVTPCHVEGRLVGWAANRAHHADLGGAAPGSMPADAVEIQQEGLRIPPVVLDDAVRAVLLANSRTPVERAGDLDAQIGANVVGAARLAELLAGGAPVDEVIAYGERRMTAALDAVPDGRWRATDVLDSAGPAPAQQPPVRIAVTLTKAGRTLTFDFTRSDRQQVGNGYAVE